MMYKLSMLFAFVAMTATGVEACGGGGAPSFTEEESQAIIGATVLPVTNDGEAGGALQAMTGDSLTMSDLLQDGDTGGYPSQPPKTSFATVSTAVAGTGINFGAKDKIIGIKKGDKNEYLNDTDSAAVLTKLNDPKTTGIWVIRGKAAPVASSTETSAADTTAESESVEEEGGMGAGPIIVIVLIIVAAGAFFATRGGDEGGEEEEEEEGEDEAA